MDDNRKNCDEMTEAAIAADELVDRLQDKAFKQLKPDVQSTDTEAFVELVEELDTAPEIKTIRRAVHGPQQRFNRKSWS